MYTLKINYKGERTVGKPNKGTNIEKNKTSFKELKLLKKKKRDREKRKIKNGGQGENKKVKKKGKLHGTAKIQRRGRGL